MLSLADPAVMSLKRAQRVQAFEPDGGETAAADSRWEFMSKANVRDKEPTAEETEQQAEKPTLPWRALEAIQSAKVTCAPAEAMMRLYAEGKTSRQHSDQHRYHALMSNAGRGGCHFGPCVPRAAAGATALAMPFGVRCLHDTACIHAHDRRMPPYRRW